MTSLAMSTGRDEGGRQGHTHEHGHSHVPENRPGPSEAGSVVLDIGPGMGAAVILTSPDMKDLEIEYRATGDEWNGKHMAVRERRGAGQPKFAAIFGPLSPSVYEFRVRGSGRSEPELRVTVAEAAVTSVSWPNLG